MADKTKPEAQKPTDQKLPMQFDTVDWQGNKTLKGKPAHPTATYKESAE